MLLYADSSSLGLAAALFVIALLAYKIGTYVHRLLWHPLAGFPGPKLAAISNLYGAYYDLIKEGQLCVHVAHLHEVYGRNCIWICSCRMPDTFQDRSCA